MTDSVTAPLKKTPLHATHVALGARMVPFGGWDMPVEYSGITAEHMAVRTAAGLFDVSHMGEVEIAGKGALEAVQHITSNDASKLQIGQIQYSGLTSPEGTFVDDLLVYRFGPSHYLLVINAGNIDKDWDWISARAKEASPDVAIVNSSNRYALIAIQGPEGAGDPADADRHRPGGHQVLLVRARRDCRRPRHGVAHRLHRRRRLRDHDSAGHGAHRVGRADAGRQAARPDSRRPRRARHAAPRSRRCACTATTSTRPPPSSKPTSTGSSAGTRPAFLGRDVLHAQKAGGTTQTLVGFEMTERAIGRHGHPVFHNGQQVGVVTSGTQTPFLKKAIGMAYVPPALKAPGTEIEIDIRGRRAKAVVVPMPFYKRPKKS